MRAGAVPDHGHQEDQTNVEGQEADQGQPDDQKAQTSMAAGFATTTATLVNIDVIASARRSSIIGIATTLMANTSGSKYQPHADAYTATNSMFSSLITWFRKPERLGISLV